VLIYIKINVEVASFSVTHTYTAKTIFCILNQAKNWKAWGFSFGKQLLLLLHLHGVCFLFTVYSLGYTVAQFAIYFQSILLHKVLP